MTAKVPGEKHGIFGSKVNFRSFCCLYSTVLLSTLSTSYEVHAADSYFSLAKEGDLLYQQRKYEEAEKKYNAALDTAVEKTGKNEEYANMLIKLGDVYSNTKQSKRAEHDYKLAEEVFKRIHGTTSLQFARALNARAELYRRQEQFDQALPLYKQALKIRTSEAHGHPDLAETSLGLAKIYLRQGKKEEALPLLKSAAQIQESAFGKSNHPLFMTLWKLADTYRDLGKDEMAIGIYKKAIDTGEILFGNSSVRVAELYFQMGKVCEKSKQKAEAGKAYHKAITILESKQNNANIKDKLSRYRAANASLKSK